MQSFDKVIAIVGESYDVYALTGSAAIRYLLERATTTGDQEIRRLRFLESIHPNDLDFCVASKGRRFNDDDDMPRMLGNYARQQDRAEKSCEYSDGVSSFDLIYIEGSLSYITVDGVNVVVPSVIESEYEDVLGLKGREGKNDLQKIEACKLLTELYGSHAEEKSTRMSRMGVQSRFSADSPGVVKTLPFDSPVSSPLFSGFSDFSDLPDSPDFPNSPNSASSPPCPDRDVRRRLF